MASQGLCNGRGANIRPTVPRTKALVTELARQANVIGGFVQVDLWVAISH